MKLTWIAFFLLLNATLFAQSANDHQTLVPDHRLFEVYETSYIKNLLNSNPFLINRWNYYLNHSFSIIDAIPGKTDTDRYPEIVIENLDKINILLLEKEQGLTHSHKLPVAYNIKNTNKCLVYLPGEKFARAFRQSLAKTGS